MIKTVLFRAAVTIGASLMPIVGAAQAAGYSRFLIPFGPSPQTGAFGSIWKTETWVHYSGLEPVTVVPRPYVCVVLCPGIAGEVDPNTAPQPFENAAVGTLPMLFHVPSDAADLFSFDSSIRDESRDVAWGGAEIPIVPESDFVAMPVRLLNVRLDDAATRTALRIFALPEANAPAVTVRFFAMTTRETGYDVRLLEELQVPLRTFDPIDGFQLIPPFATVGDLHSRPALASQTAVWIEIIPSTPQTRIWAMASTTNNATSHVTLVTPQR